LSSVSSATISKPATQPAGATETLPILGYFAGFARMDLGAGAAVGTMIFAVISMVTIVYLRFLALEEA
jgi:ABC-type sugar transport system permease subunit